MAYPLPLYGIKVVVWTTNPENHLTWYVMSYPDALVVVSDFTKDKNCLLTLSMLIIIVINRQSIL